MRHQKGNVPQNQEHRLLAGDRQSDAQYRWFRREIAATFGIGGPLDERQADEMAARTW